MSDSVWPHRWQPTRLPRPWDSPGKNTGVGCHFLLQCMKVKSESEVVQSCPTLCDPMDCSLSGSSIHGLFQARVLEWGAIAFSVVVCKVSKKRWSLSFPICEHYKEHKWYLRQELRECMLLYYVFLTHKDTIKFCVRYSSCRKLICVEQQRNHGLFLTQLVATEVWGISALKMT